MPETDADESLEELVDEAESERERFNEARSRLQEVRKRLIRMVDTLEEEDTVPEEDTEKIRNLIENGRYSDARDKIKEAREGRLSFDDEEKTAFARQFSDAWTEMDETAEAVATALLEYEETVDREDLVSYLYGKHSSMNKGDIREVFETFDEIPQDGLSTREMARLLGSFNRSLNVEPTERILEAIKRESDR